MMPRLGADGAPPALPIGTLIVGAAALLAGAVALLFNARVLVGPINSPSLVAFVHVFTLGFVGFVFAGTLQQLPAVMFVTKLAWPKLGYVSTPLLVLGSAAVVYGFATGFSPTWLQVGAAATSLAWLLLLVQLVATAARRWPKDAGSHALLLSVLFLTFTVIAGFTLAGARTSGSLARVVGYPVQLHLTLGLFGAFTLGIVGSGQKLLSMFALSKGGAQWRVRAAIYLITAALVAESIEAFARVALGPLPTLLLAGGALMQLLEVRAILKRRLRKKLEAPIQRYVMAHAFMPLAGLLILVGQPAAAAAAFLVGFIGMAVSGMLVKITSFLVWTAVFASAKTGGVSGGAPLLRDLMRDELEPVTTWSLVGGTLALCAAFITREPALAYATAGLLLVAAVSQLTQVVHVVATTVLAGRRLARAAAQPAAQSATQPAPPLGGGSATAAAPAPATGGEEN